jgi:hypothetical protein
VHLSDKGVRPVVLHLAILAYIYGSNFPTAYCRASSAPITA